MDLTTISKPVTNYLHYFDTCCAHLESNESQRKMFENAAKVIKLVKEKTHGAETVFLILCD